ncbi:MAG: hypothetical protein Crog4KO_34720 [Crocinitomicaceae bacterium]
MIEQINCENLMSILEQTPPKDLKAIHLLQENNQQTTSLIPRHTNRQAIQEATSELIAYTKQCRHIAMRLKDLSPIPLQTDQWTYGL